MLIFLFLCLRKKSKEINPKTEKDEKIIKCGYFKLAKIKNSETNVI